MRRGALLVDEIADAPQDFRGAIAGLADVLQGNEHLGVGLGVLSQAADAALGVVPRGVQGLVELVRQTGGHLAHQAQAAGVRNSAWWACISSCAASRSASTFCRRAMSRRSLWMR